MLKGWIIARKEAGPELEALGVRLGPYDEGEGSFESCEVSAEAFEKLNPLWGRFYWGLQPAQGGNA